MSKVLEQFYRLYFSETIEEGVTDEIYLLDKAKALAAKTDLLARLSLEERRLFEDYSDANSLYNEGLAMAHFMAGAQLGAQLAQELNLNSADLANYIQG